MKSTCAKVKNPRQEDLERFNLFIKSDLIDLGLPPLHLGSNRLAAVMISHVVLLNVCVGN